MRNRLSKTQRLAIYDNFKSGTNSATYDENGQVLYSPQEKRRLKIKKILLRTLFVVVPLAVLAGIIYLPQLFVSDEPKNPLVFRANKNSWSSFEEYLSENRDKDFDGDGVSNYIESENGSSPFSQDTDKDGLLDDADAAPSKAGNEIFSTLASDGATYKDPYKINGVILWADNKNAWTHGAVIPIQEGYRFTSFCGWASFPDEGYAYQYTNGRHQKLKFREDINAWYISCDCTVVFVDEQPENTYLINLAGWSFYSRNGLGKFLAWLLPERGWFTACEMWLDDTFIDATRNTYVDFSEPSISKLSPERYTSYSDKLTDVAEVYALIDDGYYVLTSLMSEENGESIVVVYGYTHDGNLVAADPYNKDNSCIIYINACCSRAIDKQNNITENSWFEFYGGGFSSKYGDLIGFFSAISSDGRVYE